MSIRTVRDRRQSIDVRLRALNAVQSTPELAAAALELMTDMTAKRGKYLTELPLGRLSTLFSHDHVPDLLALYSTIRNTRDMSRGKPTKRIADQVAVRTLLDELPGATPDPPKLLQHETECSTCRWPALTRCRRCSRTGCGLENCMPDLLEPVELPYLVCQHRGSAGDLFCTIRNDAGPATVNPPATSRPGPALELHDAWRTAGEVSADAGLAGIVPVGGGSAIKVSTAFGDGKFPIEVRACPQGNIQARVTFAACNSNSRSTSVGVAGSYTGFFAICDPVLAHYGLYALSPGETGRVWPANFGLLIRAARVEVTGIRQGKRFAQLIFVFRPTVKSVPHGGS